MYMPSRQRDNETDAVVCLEMTSGVAFAELHRYAQPRLECILEPPVLLLFCSSSPRAKA